MLWVHTTLCIIAIFSLLTLLRLDAESEHLVKEALDHVMKGKTVIVIAHRLSTIQNADRIAVIDNGMVAELGDHQALISRGGIYKQLVMKQLAHGLK